MSKKAVLLLAVAIGLGAVGYHFRGLLLDRITPVFPQITNFGDYATQAVEWVKGSWQTILGSITGAMVFFNYLYGKAKSKIQQNAAKQMETAQGNLNTVLTEKTEITRQVESLEGEVATLKNENLHLTEIETNYNTLVQEVEQKDKQIDQLIIAKNEAERLASAIMNPTKNELIHKLELCGYTITKTVP